MESLDLLQRSLYYERYVNECARNSVRLNGGFDPDYQFNSETPSFELIAHRVPRDEVAVILNDPSTKVRDDFLDETTVKFCLHSQFKNRTDITCMLDLFPYPKGDLVEASPTSSMRTLLIKGKRYALKMHCPIKVSNFYRTLGRKTIQHSVMVSKYLAEINHPRFAVLPETLGLAFPQRDGQRSWGFIVREMTPRPYVPGSEDRLLLPCFSLFYKWKHQPDRGPLLLDLIDRSSKTPVDFVLDEIIFPIIEYWIVALRDHGIITIPHCQNALLEMSPDLSKVYRIVIRDFDNFINDRLRVERGLSMEGLVDIYCMSRDNNYHPFGGEVSLAYDNSISKMLFDPLAKVLEQNFQVEPALLQKRCRDYIEELLPNHKEFFPEVAYKHTIITTEEGNKHTLEIDSDSHNWRP